MSKRGRPKVVTIVLAGGAGGRMKELTHRRSKPVLPFGGSYRLIDFPLSNLCHSGFSDVWIVEQFQPHGLNEHLSNGRPWDLDRTRGGLLLMPPFEAKDNNHAGFARGNAEALNMQRQFLEQAAPDLVMVTSADQVYRSDYRDLVDFHLQTGADLSVLAWNAPPFWDGDLSRHSILGIEGDKVVDFAYKPEEPATRWVATEVFLYSCEALLDTLQSLHQKLGDDMGDYGDHLLPRMVRHDDVRVLEHQGYWRDVGTVESYWKGHQDLLLDQPPLDLEAPDWPLLTQQTWNSPARILASARIESSLISAACRVQGSVVRSVVGPGCVIAEGAVIEDCVVMDGCRIGPKARLRRAIVDAGSEVDEAFEDSDEIRIVSPSTATPTKAARTRRPMES